MPSLPIGFSLVMTIIFDIFALKLRSILVVYQQLTYKNYYVYPWIRFYRQTYRDLNPYLSIDHAVAFTITTNKEIGHLTQE